MQPSPFGPTLTYRVDRFKGLGQRSEVWIDV